MSAADTPPFFTLSELRDLRSAFVAALMYVGPVGISKDATTVWREARNWRDRLESLISEYEEYEALTDQVWERDARSPSLPDVGGLTLGDPRIHTLREEGLA